MVSMRNVSGLIQRIIRYCPVCRRALEPEVRGVTFDFLPSRQKTFIVCPEGHCEFDVEGDNFPSIIFQVNKEYLRDL